MRNCICVKFVALLLGGLVPSTSQAHGAESLAVSIWTNWGEDYWSVVALVVAGGCYVLGARSTWRHSRRARVLRKREHVVFAIGWSLLFVALVSPLDALSEVLFFAHMLQHEILMLVAAPLLVIARPIGSMLKPLPRMWRRRCARFLNSNWIIRFWRAITIPIVAWSVHTIVLWLWHAPLLFQAGLENEWVHGIQHLSFFLSAVVFWWSLLHGLRKDSGYGIAFVLVFATAVSSGVLGALLTFAPTAWYPAYEATTMAWGFTPVQDQQLGGLIMWVPAGVVYLGAGLFFLASLVKKSDPCANRQSIGNET